MVSARVSILYFLGCLGIENGNGPNNGRQRRKRISLLLSFEDYTAAGAAIVIFCFAVAGRIYYIIIYPIRRNAAVHAIIIILYA